MKFIDGYLKNDECGCDLAKVSLIAESCAIAVGVFLEKRGSWPSNREYRTIE